MIAVDPHAPRIEGRVFHLPSGRVGVDAAGERLAVGLFGGQAHRENGDVIEYEMSAQAVDVGLVREGRCPLLLEHMRTLDYLLGSVAGVEIHGPLARCVVRLAPGGHGDRVWELLSRGFPLSLSMGARIDNAVRVRELPGGGAEYRVDRWRLCEISVTIYGKDESAHLKVIGRDEDAAGVLARMGDEASAGSRAAVARALRLDRWRDDWPALAGTRLADRFGLDAEELALALDEEVRRHCEALETEMSP